MTIDEAARTAAVEIAAMHLWHEDRVPRFTQIISKAIEAAAFPAWEPAITMAHNLLTAAGVQEGGELATRVEQLAARAEAAERDLSITKALVEADGRIVRESESRAVAAEQRVESMVAMLKCARRQCSLYTEIDKFLAALSAPAHTLPGDDHAEPEPSLPADKYDYCNYCGWHFERHVLAGQSHTVRLHRACWSELGQPQTVEAYDEAMTAVRRRIEELTPNMAELDALAPAPQSEPAKPIASVYFSRDGKSLESLDVCLDTSIADYGEWIKGEDADIALKRSLETHGLTGAHLPLYAKTLMVGGEGMPTIAIDLETGRVGPAPENPEAAATLEQLKAALAATEPKEGSA